MFGLTTTHMKTCSLTSNICRASKPFPAATGRLRDAHQRRQSLPDDARYPVASITEPLQPSKRKIMSLFLAAAAAQALPISCPSPAPAYTPPPSGKRRNVDVLDGYEFLYPDYYAPVSTSGNDIFFRNPYNVEENLFVNITSPSSSKFDSVDDFGTPEQAAQRLRQQYLGEFMSTRLGSQKKAEILSAKTRVAGDRTYYDVEMRAQSYASRSPLAQTQAEIDSTFVMEWDRRLLWTLGVANKRLYELRLQCPEAKFDANSEDLRAIATSFRCKEISAR